MNQPENRLSRRDAERLLDAPATHDSALGQALAAAAAPPHPHELHREDAAVAAFHTTRSTPPPARRTAFVSPTRLGSRAAVHAVVATGAVLVMGSGAFALARAVDLPDLPTLPGHATDRATEAVSGTGSATSSATAPGSTSSGTPDGTAGGSPSGKPTGKPTSVPSTSASGSPSATPSPNLPGLCTAFQATDRSDGRSLTSPAFAALVTAAGGADRVATYCVALIGAPETGTPSGQPTPTSKPTPIPTGNPTPTPTGKPTDKPTPTDRPTPTDTPTPTPTGKPSEPPTGSPTDQPSPGKPTDAPEHSGRGGGKDSTTSGS